MPTCSICKQWWPTPEVRKVRNKDLYICEECRRMAKMKPKKRRAKHD